MTVNVTGQA